VRYRAGFQWCELELCQVRGTNRLREIHGEDASPTRKIPDSKGATVRQDAFAGDHQPEPEPAPIEATLVEGLKDTVDEAGRQAAALVLHLDQHPIRLGQDQAIVRAPKVREAANVVGLVVQGGITRGQTLRIGVVLSALVCANPPPQRFGLAVFDSQGTTLATFPIPSSAAGPGAGPHISFFDLDADQLPQHLFDNRGRAELRAVLGITNPGPPQTRIPGPLEMTAEVFENVSGKTTAHIPGTPLLSCGLR